MRRCPKCGRTFDNDRQKFCTLDGTGLLDVEGLNEAESQRVEQGETIRIDSAGLNSAELNDEMTRIISREPPAQSLPSFDPYKTVVAESSSTSSAPPAPATPPAAPPAAAPPTTPTPAAMPSTPPPREENPALMRTMASVPPPPVHSASLPPPPPTQPPVAEPPAPPPQPQSPPPPIQAAAPRPKKSKVPLVLGILAVLFIIAIAAAGAGYWFVVRPMLAKRAALVNGEHPTETPTPGATPGAATPTPKAVEEVPPYSPPADAVEFVNSKDNLDGKLAEHYVDFSFYYPERWQKDPKSGVPGATNFAKVQRQLAPDAPQEIFAVGWYESTGSKDTDQLSFPRLAAQRSADFAHDYPEYRKISEGSTNVGPYEGYEFRFGGVFRNTERGDVNIWGRVIFLPPLEGKKGVTLLMLASSLTEDVKSANDVGVKGELPMMLASFRFGK
jgi:hypothetical protein